MAMQHFAWKKEETVFYVILSDEREKKLTTHLDSKQT